YRRARRNRRGQQNHQAQRRNPGLNPRRQRRPRPGRGSGLGSPPPGLAAAAAAAAPRHPVLASVLLPPLPRWVWTLPGLPASCLGLPIGCWSSTIVATATDRTSDLPHSLSSVAELGSPDLRETGAYWSRWYRWARGRPGQPGREGPSLG